MNSTYLVVLLAFYGFNCMLFPLHPFDNIIVACWRTKKEKKKNYIVTRFEIHNPELKFFPVERSPNSELKYLGYNSDLVYQIVI